MWSERVRKRETSRRGLLVVLACIGAGCWLYWTLSSLIKSLILVGLISGVVYFVAPPLLRRLTRQSRQRLPDDRKS